MRQLSDNSGKRYTIFTHSVGTTTHEKNFIVGKQIMQEAVICRSRGGLSANEKEKNASNDNIIGCHSF